MVICLERGSDLHMFQLMPLPLSLASVKSRLVLPFWYRLTWVVAEKGPLNGCVCVCVCVYRTGSPGQLGLRVAGFPGHWVDGSQNVTQFHDWSRRRSRICSAYAAPSSLVCCTNRPRGHLWRCKERHRTIDAVTRQPRLCSHWSKLAASTTQQHWSSLF